MMVLKDEEDAILSIKFDKPSIVSTGGSVIYSKKGMDHLLSSDSLIIYLNTDFDKLVERTDNFTNRGIIFNGKTRKQLYQERHLLYQHYCDFEIITNDLTPEQISSCILTNIMMKRIF